MFVMTFRGKKTLRSLWYRCPIFDNFEVKTFTSVVEVINFRRYSGKIYTPSEGEEGHLHQELILSISKFKPSRLD